jgi:hypothetical protein
MQKNVIHSAVPEPTSDKSQMRKWLQRFGPLMLAYNDTAKELTVALRLSTQAALGFLAGWVCHLLASWTGILNFFWPW